ncbi:MAG: DUF6516 family protein [Steroidobacteraceae bacterium]
MKPQPDRDSDLEWLRDFHGRRYWLECGWSIRIRAVSVAVTESRPFGIRYALTLHDEGGGRLLGFDNAHGISRETVFDHQHPYRRTGALKPYGFLSAAELIKDFFEAVEMACKLEGKEFSFNDELFELDLADDEEVPDGTQIIE